MEEKLIITPNTKVAELLEPYPELEDVLIDLAPAFTKLKNPALRNTIASVTSLQQVASVGEISVEVIINKLRGIVGQEEMEDSDVDKSYSGDHPDWFNSQNIAFSFDAREMISSGGHPVGKVMGDLNSFDSGKIYEMITPFLPAPLLDKVKEMGYECWTLKENESLFKNYFIRK